MKIRHSASVEKKDEFVFWGTNAQKLHVFATHVHKKYSMFAVPHSPLQFTFYIQQSKSYTISKFQPSPNFESKSLKGKRKTAEDFHVFQPPNTTRFRPIHPSHPPRSHRSHAATRAPEICFFCGQIVKPIEGRAVGPKGRFSFLLVDIYMTTSLVGGYIFEIS